MVRECSGGSVCSQCFRGYLGGAGSQVGRDAMLRERTPPTPASPVPSVVAAARRILGERRQHAGGRGTRAPSNAPVSMVKLWLGGSDDGRFPLPLLNAPRGRGFDAGPVRAASWTAVTNAGSTSWRLSLHSFV